MIAPRIDLKITIFTCSSHHWNCGCFVKKSTLVQMFKTILPNWFNVEDDTLHVGSLCASEEPYVDCLFNQCIFPHVYVTFNKDDVTYMNVCKANWFSEEDFINGCNYWFSEEDFMNGCNYWFSEEDFMNVCNDWFSEEDFMNSCNYWEEDFMNGCNYLFSEEDFMNCCNYWFSEEDFMNGCNYWFSEEDFPWMVILWFKVSSINI